MQLHTTQGPPLGDESVAMKLLSLTLLMPRPPRVTARPAAYENPGWMTPWSLTSSLMFPPEAPLTPVQWSAQFAVEVARIASSRLCAPETQFLVATTRWPPKNVRLSVVPQRLAPLYARPGSVRWSWQQVFGRTLLNRQLSAASDTVVSEWQVETVLPFACLVSRWSDSLLT